MANQILGARSTGLKVAGFNEFGLLKRILGQNKSRAGDAAKRAITHARVKAKTMSNGSIRQRIWMQGWKDGACDFPAVHIHNAPEHDGLYDAGHAEGLKARAMAQKQAELVDAPSLQPREKPSRRRQQSLFGEAPKAKGAVSVFVQYREAFSTGVGEALKREFVAPSIKGPDDPFVRALGVFAVNDGTKLGGAELLTWIRGMARRWIIEAQPTDRDLGYPLVSFVQWLNRGAAQKTRVEQKKTTTVAEEVTNRRAARQ